MLVIAATAAAPAAGPIGYFAVAAAEAPSSGLLAALLQ